MKVAAFHRFDTRIGRFSGYHQAILVHDNATEAFCHVVVHVVVVIVVEMIVTPVIEPIVFVVV